MCNDKTSQLHKCQEKNSKRKWLLIYYRLLTYEMDRVISMYKK